MTLFHPRPRPPLAATLSPPPLLARVFALEWAGNIALAVLAALWLQIPDSHTWEFLLSILSAAVISVLCAWLCRAVSIALRPGAGLEGRSPAPLWLTTLIVVVSGAVFLLLLDAISLCRAHEVVYAGYWNSQLSPAHRALFPYERFLELEDRLCDLLVWLAAALLVPAMIETIAAGLTPSALGRAFRVYLKPMFWLAALATGMAADALTARLLSLTPGHASRPGHPSVELSAHAQVFSLGWRLLLGYTADILLWCVVLAVAAHFLRPFLPPRPMAAAAADRLPE